MIFIESKIFEKLRADKSHIHFLTVYAKNEMSDLTSNEKKILKAIAEEIKNA